MITVKNNLKFDIVSIQFLLLAFSSVSKIYFGSSLSGVFLDFLFVTSLAIGFYGAALYTEKIYIFYFGVLVNFISIFYFFVSYVPGFSNSVLAFRSTGLYMAAFFLPILFNINNSVAKKIALYSIFVGVASSLWAIRQYFYPFLVEIIHSENSGGAAKFYGDEFQGGDDSFRPFGFFVTSVHLALYLNFAAVCCFFYKFEKSYKKYLCTIIIVFGIVFSMSRTSYIACILASVSLFFLRSISGGFFVNLLKSGFFVSVAILFGYIFADDLLRARIDSMVSGTEISSFQSRFLFWDAAWVAIEKNYFGYGTGAGSWGMKDVMGLGSDSGYLKIIIEFGLFFGMLLLALIFVVLLFGAKKIIAVDRFSGGDGLPLLFACFSTVVANLVQMVTNQSLEAYPNNFIFWFSICYLLNFKK